MLGHGIGRPHEKPVIGEATHPLTAQGGGAEAQSFWAAASAALIVPGAVLPGAKHLFGQETDGIAIGGVSVAEINLQMKPGLTRFGMVQRPRSQLSPRIRPARHSRLARPGRR